jgi:hypothetical protein
MCAGVLLCGHNLQYDHKARFGEPRKTTPASKVSSTSRADAKPAYFLQVHMQFGCYWYHYSQDKAVALALSLQPRKSRHLFSLQHMSA